MTVIVAPPVLSQRSYAGAGDIDDCWVVATVWAALASRPDLWKPTVPQFRAAAGKPDLPGPTGGNIDDCYQGARGCWPLLEPTSKWESANWAATIAIIKAGHPVSIALDSGALPPRLRFGFYGKHQVGVLWTGSRLAFANPLAAEGSIPLTITETELRTAMARLLAPTWPVSYRMIVFPVPLAPTHRAYIARNATVRVYSLNSRPGVDCIAKPWIDEQWGSRASSAPCEAPVARPTCDGKSHATTVKVTKGHFAGKHIWIHPGDVTVKEV